MVKFGGKILQFGFGAVGKSFYEKLPFEVEFDEYKYYIVTKYSSEFEAFVNLGGMISNFIVADVTKENYEKVFGDILSAGDMLIDFADTVGTKDICRWCADNGIMYINTGEADWPYRWYSILEENLIKQEMKKEYAHIGQPIVLQHGNNPGLVSHFVKEALEYIVEGQFKPKGLSKFKKKKNLSENESKLQYSHLKELIKQGKFNELAQALGVRMIHVSDIDLQQIKDEYVEKKLYNTWCPETFLFEMLSESTCNIGPHEELQFKDPCNFADIENGFLQFTDMAVHKKCNSLYPDGPFEGYLVPHEETLTIANGLEVKEIDGNKVSTIYRPTVMFVYKPCDYAERYFKEAKVNNYPNPDPDKPQDREDSNECIIHGYEYPKEYEIVYREKIATGTEYVGVLILGENFEPVWVGNRVELSYLYKSNKASYWQTPTVTPVAISALAAVSWMISHKSQGGIYFPDDIRDYKYIIKLAEKYISKTVYKTFSKEMAEELLHIDLKKLQLQDVFVNTVD